MSQDLLATSRGTWRAAGTVAPRVPEQLYPSGGDPLTRFANLRARFAHRRQNAETYYAGSRDPERGLPVAENQAVIGFMRRLLSTRKPEVIALVVLNALASVVGLIVPRVLGDLIDRVASRDPSLPEQLLGICLMVVGIVVVQALLSFGARWISAVFGQDMLAAAREDIVRTVLRLPLGRVESASTGDLITRVTRDVGTMSTSVERALPQLVIALTMTLLTLFALFLNSWLLAIPSVLAIIVLALWTLQYLKRALQGYITEGGTYSVINTTLTESIEGARTVEAFGTQRRRAALSDEDIELSAQAERYTMSLRNLLFVVMDYCYQGPLVAVVALGAWGYTHDLVTLGQITAAAIYIQQLVEPLDRLVQSLDMLQVGTASTTRLLGIAAVPADREATDEVPTSTHLLGRDLRFAYRDDHDVLHGVDLELRDGERLAIVGPSGSGKSTLGRLLAGINGPRTGAVTVGNVDLMHLPLPVLRTEVALVTQEHHVFVGTLRDNIVLAREHTATLDEVKNALTAVDASEWVERLPLGLDTKVGSGNQTLTPAQAQQVALARLVIADPHTLVLDEATSLIDPQTARHLEGSMSSLLTGRTVVAIAHRLHTAHDADRIAVVIDGRIAELGSHDELMGMDAEYAALWRAWTS